MQFVYFLRDLISVPPLAKSMRSNYHLISTNLLDLFELKSISWPKRERLSVDGSSDSEDDNEIPFLGIRTNVHGFQNPAKIQL
jgi:hypothetical protein